jgi:Zinc carboxypeptidase
MTKPPTKPTLPADINTALETLTNNHKDNCELITLPNKSAAPPGVEIKCVRIHVGAQPKDPAVLLIGGVHAREMAPPDALLRLAQNLLEAFSKEEDIVFEPLTAQVGAPPLAISYPAYRIAAEKVQQIVKSIDVYILPCVNPDGRLYDILHPPSGPDPAEEGWRKNRRPNPDSSAPAAIGVDLNRNCDIAWDFMRYYDMPQYRTSFSRGPASTTDTDETFNGVTEPARTVTVAGAPTGGTYTLIFDGATSIPIAFDAPASAVQAALATLAKVGAGNVTVTGANGGPYTVTFVGARGHPVPMLTAAYSALTGGTEPHIEIRHGGPHSEPETLNVQWLIDNRKIRFFLDVHQFGRAVMYSWGLEDNGTDKTMSFQQGSWDWRRDGLPVSATVPAGHTNYSEYAASDFPYFAGNKVKQIAEAITTAILLSSGAEVNAAPGADPRKDHSLYKAGSSARFYEPRGGGPLTGTSHDYAFSRQFIETSRAPIYALAMEVGHHEEGGFHPDYTSPNNQYQKIEREVHAAAIELLLTAVRWCRYCVIATAAYEGADHPDVKFLRSLRDQELRSTPFGARIVAAMERVYYSFAPPIARLLFRRPRARALARTLAVRPTVYCLRALVAITAPIGQRRVRVALRSGAILTLVAAIVLAAAAAVALAVRSAAGG